MQLLCGAIPHWGRLSRRPAILACGGAITQRIASEAVRENNRVLRLRFAAVSLSAAADVSGRFLLLLVRLLLRRLHTVWCSILFSGPRSFVFLCCDTRMYRRFRGCLVVRDIELSMSLRFQIHS